MEPGKAGARAAGRTALVVGALVAVNACFFVASLAALILSLKKAPQASQVSAAHLVLKLKKNSSMNRGMLDWFDKDVEGAFLGPSFEYSAPKLIIKKGGLYCIYAQINVEHRGPHINTAMDAALYIYRNDESSALLTLRLSANETVFYTNSTSQIHRLSSNDQLYGKLTGTTEADSNWALQASGNFFGVFRINEKETAPKRL